MEATVAPAPEAPRPDIRPPQPPVPDPDREKKEYFEWRQELL